MDSALTGGEAEISLRIALLFMYFLVYVYFFSCLFPTSFLAFCAFGGFFSCFLYISCFFFIYVLGCSFFAPVFLSSPFYFLPSFLDLSEFDLSPSFLLFYLQAICFLQNSSFLGQNTTVLSRQISYIFQPLLAVVIGPISRI